MYAETAVMTVVSTILEHSEDRKTTILDHTHCGLGKCEIAFTTILDHSENRITAVLKTTITLLTPTSCGSNRRNAHIGEIEEPQWKKELYNSVRLILQSLK